MPEAVTIVGAGPAGLAAAIYLQRAGIPPLLLEKETPGGLLRSANWVENYPGFPGGISGKDLAGLFLDQLTGVGGKVTKGEVTSVSKTGTSFEVRTSREAYSSRCVILATGTRPTGMRLPGLPQDGDPRVVDEITDIPSRIRRRRILIIGGGDAAFDYALNLERRGSDVTILTRSSPRCLPLLRERARSWGIKVKIGYSPERLLVSKRRLVLKCKTRSGTKDLKTRMILLACGRTVNTDVLSPELRRRAQNLRGIQVNGVKGLFLVGDVARGVHRQAGIAVGDGIGAAMLVQELIAEEVAGR